jgi:Tfp pilus assembly protein PilF
VNKAAQLAPNNATYHRNLGELLRRLGKLDAAIQAHNRATTLAPDSSENYFHLALALSDKKAYAEAEKNYRRSIELTPSYGEAWNNLGACLEKQGKKQDSENVYAHATQINPRHAEAQNNLGAVYSEQGKLDEARQCFEAAVEAKPDFVEAHYNLSSLKTYKDGDSHLAMLEAVLSKKEQLPTAARIRYSFALGKALDDTKQYERAFAAYAEGNRLQHAEQPCNESLLNKLAEDIPAVFTPAFLKKAADTTDTHTPVFIVGMPRSGTTLIEQILATHNSVFGAGELSIMDDAVKSFSQNEKTKNFVRWAEHMTDNDFKSLGETYLQHTKSLAPSKQYITDKMPANFFYIGMIYRALPNAKIINAMRDPMDSCFSCYSKLFNHNMPFSYNQETLGHYFVRYTKIMDYWQSVLPEGTILNLSYEEMIADNETQSRRLTDFVGLPWDKKCLEFYKNDRLVQTASITQVRKPIYKTSVNRWQNFAKDLQPLMNIVKDYRPKNN